MNDTTPMFPDLTPEKVPLTPAEAKLHTRLCRIAAAAVREALTKDDDHTAAWARKLIDDVEVGVYAFVRAHLESPATLTLAQIESMAAEFGRSLVALHKRTS